MLPGGLPLHAEGEAGHALCSPSAGLNLLVVCQRMSYTGMHRQQHNPGHSTSHVAQYGIQVLQLHVALAKEVVEELARGNVYRLRALLKKPRARTSKAAAYIKVAAASTAKKVRMILGQDSVE